MIRYSAERRKPPRAAILIAVLICLLFVVVVVAAMLQSLLIERRQMLMLGRQTQASCLARSALDRAAARLQSEPDYEGETWQIAAERIGGRDAALVKI